VQELLASGAEALQTAKLNNLTSTNDVEHHQDSLNELQRGKIIFNSDRSGSK
jgi:hypothetical protein